MIILLDGCLMSAQRLNEGQDVKGIHTESFATTNLSDKNKQVLDDL